MRAIVLLVWLAASVAPIAWLVWRALPVGRDLLVDGAFLQLYGLTLLRAAGAAALAVVLAWPAAVAVAGYRFSGRRLAVRVLLLARLAPPLLLIAPGSGLLGFLWLAPAWLRVPLAHLVFGVPVAIWLIARALARTPQGVVDLARGDGLGLFAQLRYVLWPRLWPALVLAWSVCFVASWSEAALACATGADLPGAILGVPAGAGLPRRAAAAVLALAPALPCGWLLAWALRRGR